MPVIFPTSPSNGQVYTANNGSTYQFDGEKWKVFSSTTAVARGNMPEVMAGELQRLHDLNASQPGTLVMGMKTEYFLPFYYNTTASPNVYLPHIQDTNFGISPFGEVRFGATSAYNNVPLGGGATNNGAVYWNNVSANVNSSSGANKLAPYGIGRAFTVRDLFSSLGEMDYIYWGYGASSVTNNITVTGGQVFRLVPHFTDGRTYWDIFQTLGSNSEVSAISYTLPTRPWGWYLNNHWQCYYLKLRRANPTTFTLSAYVNGRTTPVWTKTAATAAAFDSLFSANTAISSYFIGTHPYLFAHSRVADGLANMWSIISSNYYEPFAY